MKSEIKMPSMGESISEATIGQILAPSGTIVKADAELLEIETDKVNQILYAPQAGQVTLNVKSGDTVTIGQSLGFIESAAETEKKEPTTKQADKPEIKPEPKQETPKAPAPTPVAAAKPAPVASLRYTTEDFLASLKAPVAKEQKMAPSVTAPSSTSTRETRRPLSKIRKVIGQRLVEVQRTIAMLTTFNEVDMARIIELREKYKETFSKTQGVKLGFMPFFVKAVVEALKAFPVFNSYLDKEEIVHREYYDMGIAVGTEKGVLVPVVRNCDQLSFAGIEQAIEHYAKQAREGKIVMDDLQGGGFTITNGGVYGSLLSTPILNASQCGILGMHKIEKRPVVIEDQIVIRPMMYLALSYDHRLVDGQEAVSFLVHVKNELEDPARLLIGI